MRPTVAGLRNPGENYPRGHRVTVESDRRQEHLLLY